VQLSLQTVGTIGSGDPHPDWVSYLAQGPEGKWIHSTDLQVPANSLVHVTIYQYDSSSGLRNPYFAQVQGTTGRTMQVDRTSVDAVDPNEVAHTFAIPQLGVYVPLPGVSNSATNACSAAPCTPAQAHRTITFTFRTKGKGKYRWQCFVPCGAGFVTGNGGPMQTFNYMAGSLAVV
jgi:heme/copper-type cytochrome/quinol oxidase subunit 2